MQNNGVMKHIERFRKVVGLAQKLDWLKIDPFRNYQIKFKKVEMDYLEPDELQKIEETKFKLERLEFTKDLFVFSCYTGLAYIDAVQLNHEEIHLGTDRPPRFAYRGLMLDVGRYFFPMDFVKRYVELMTIYKYNIFHLHLTDDQGWRIEIKKYPELTEIGSWRKQSIVGHKNGIPRKYDGVPHGRFYTQAELKELVQYASERHITIIPKIDMPGHSQAALAAYPNLGCIPDTTYEVSCNWVIHKDVYCPKEETFRFIEDVLTEVMDIFPSKYIHIGGDECLKDRWKESAFCQDLIKKHNLKNEEDPQSYFIHCIDSFVTSKRRTIIGWDEILEGGLSPNAIVISWRGGEGGIAAAKQKHKVVMSPNTYCYLDYYQVEDKSKEPLAFGNFLPLDKVYSYNPVSNVFTPEEADYILGIQGNLWTEYINEQSKAEYMTYPRACATAEVGWTSAENKGYNDFLIRLKAHSKRLLPVNDLIDYLCADFLKPSFIHKWHINPDS